MLFARLIVRSPLRVKRSPSQNYRSFFTSYCCATAAPLSSRSDGRRRSLRTAPRSDSTKKWGRTTREFGALQEASEMASSGKKVVTPSSLVNCHLQVIGTGNCEVSPSLCLFTDSQRYIFNCGENFQRFTREYRMRILKEPTLFVTRVSWRNLGGLPGFAMSYRDCGRTHLHIHGPARIAQFAEVTRYFIGRERLKLVTNWETTPSGELMSSSSDVYKDENVTITTVELESQTDAGAGERPVRHDSPNAASSLDDDDVMGENVVPKPKRVKRDSDTQTLPPSTAAFICKLVDTKGKFNPERAKELGLKSGPIYKKLVAGESVTAPDGRVIHPSDVIGAKQIGPTFIVMECPSRDYISSVISHAKLQKDYFSNLGQEVALVVHISPVEVLEEDEYCRWAASFGESTKHLILNESLCPMEVGLRALMKIQYPLYLMNPNVHHPPPNYEEYSYCQVSDLKLFRLLSNAKDAVIVGKSFLKFHLKPLRKMGEDTSDVLRPVEENIAEHIREIRSNPKLASAIATGQTLAFKSATSNSPKPSNSKAKTGCSNSTMPVNNENTKECSNNDDENIETIKPHLSTTIEASGANLTTKVDCKIQNLCVDPCPLTTSFHGSNDAVVTFLGTGASLPSRYRNVSGILVQTPSSGNFLLDCGEGSLSQIYRCFPRKIADEIILNLKVIFISHIHGDHHLGLVNVLKKRERLLAQLRKEEKPYHGDTLVIAPKYNINWMNRYRELIEKLSYRTLDCSTLTRKQADHDKTAVCDFRFETVPVIHCSEAYGVVVSHTSGWSVVYSGDTRPCPALVEAGHGATLLIHEATLEDGLLDHAVAKKHCTVSEALEISDKMNPDFTILTHFSQRYPKIPSFLMADQLHSRVAVAFDCMSVNLKQLDQLHKYLPTMRDIFTEVVEMDSEDFECTSSTASSSWDFTVPS